MATNYPSALDNGTSLPYPTSTDDLSSPNLAAGQGNQNDATIAVESLIGTNATQTTPTVSGNVLQATSATASEWGLLTSANVATSTGTGEFVFATSPTLTSPTLNTPTITSPSITGSLGNISTGTINASGLITASSGLTLPTGALFTAGGGLTVPAGATLTLPNNSITAPMLATNAITLGYAQITASFSSTSSATPQQVTGLSVTCTIPAGGRGVKITVFGQDMYSNGTGFVSIWDGPVGTGTQLNRVQYNGGSGHSSPCICIGYESNPTAGSKTYNVSIQGDGTNPMTLESDGGTTPSFILVELI